MLLESFKITGSAVMQIFLLGLIGYILARKNLLGESGLAILSRLVVEVTLPLLIFCQLVKDFRFSLYPNWWIFPLLSFLITIAGLLAGYLFFGFINGAQRKMQFLSLVTFQNSGYLPLVLVAALLPKDKLEPMFIYLFLCLLGFNLTFWSLSVYMLSSQERKRFELGSLFSPPVVAMLFSLLVIFFGLHRFIPDMVIKPLGMIGNCTLPLAMFVVGGNLALIHLKQVDKKAISLMLLAKLALLPLLGLWLVVKFNLPELIGLLVIIELAAPPATSLSVVIRHYKKEDLLISQGIFFGHIVSLITIPVFLSLYFMFTAMP